jgi:hypothetical protein
MSRRAEKCPSRGLGSDARRRVGRNLQRAKTNRATGSPLQAAARLRLHVIAHTPLIWVKSTAVRSCFPRGEMRLYSQPRTSTGSLHRALSSAASNGAHGDRNALQCFRSYPGRVDRSASRSQRPRRGRRRARAGRSDGDGDRRRDLLFGAGTSRYSQLRTDLLRQR